ncbi:DUF1850 domain-containing protein [Halomicrobium salinisoli]|uniref:DUF1850 domain-containing protein n=1 Tax=Halomicrobium salinisoli TaxID=2878391 RepID=UPI001CF03A03|nr:DUF1850 domain-containing protein [Halomicrobium salinisoli]
MSRIRVVVALAVLLALAGVAAAVPGERVLVVADTETGERYLTVPVENDTRVALEYTHSVEQSRVYDGYRVRGERLEMTRMEFESYGWGLPADANVTLRNGTFVYDPDGNVTTLTVEPGRIAGHDLLVGDRRYDLVNVSDARTVDVSVERRSTLGAAADRFQSHE